MVIREIEAGCYTIKFDANPLFSLGSADNRHHYDAVYRDESEYLVSQYDIAVFLEDGPLKRVLIGATGGATSVYKTSFVIEADRLVICCSNSVFCLSIPDLLLLWKVNADDVTCFQVFKHQSDYLIHGELSISRISHDGQLMWERSGRDIFVSSDPNVDEFIIKDDHILITDFSDNKYKFTFEGRLFRYL